jgi:predicted DCC family thiol-disulfide oxidoreductase YuxK
MATSAASTTTTETDARPIVFYDGECGLCNRFVQFVLDRDSKDSVLLAPLQGETFREHCPDLGTPDLSTVLVLDGGRVYERSGAALRVLRRLRFPWPIVGFVGSAGPRPIRDWLYNRVASNRYRWFGAADACRLPSPRERLRLLP